MRSNPREKHPSGGRRSGPWPPSKRKLDELVEQAVVDACDESEQRGGFFAMLEEHLAIPFETEVLGVPVTVERLDLTDANEIVAVCRRGTVRQLIPILYLPLRVPRPRGAEWIEAYRHWAG